MNYHVLVYMSRILFSQYVDNVLPYGFKWNEDTLEQMALWYEYKWYSKKIVDYWYD